MIPLPLPPLVLVPFVIADTVELAANVLEWRGHLEYDDDIPADVAQSMLALLTEGRCGLNGLDLAEHYLADRQAEWEISLPVAEHPCGALYKPLLDGGGRELFYLIDVDGRLGDHVGAVRRNGAGDVKQADPCPACGQPLAAPPAAKTTAGGRYVMETLF